MSDKTNSERKVPGTDGQTDGRTDKIKCSKHLRWGREGVETNQKQVRRIGSSQQKERRGEYKSVGE